MIRCNKGQIELSGSIAEIMADWTTITCAMYKLFVEKGAPKEMLNKTLTQNLFLAVAEAERLMEVEE
jgi:hypothetical protein